MGDLKYNVHALQCKGLFWSGGVVGGIRSKRPTSVFDRGPSSSYPNEICQSNPFIVFIVFVALVLGLRPLRVPFRWLLGI